MGMGFLPKNELPESVIEIDETPGAVVSGLDAEKEAELYSQLHEVYGEPTWRSYLADGVAVVTILCTLIGTNWDISYVTVAIPTLIVYLWTRR